MPIDDSRYKASANLNRGIELTRCAGINENFRRVRQSTAALAVRAHSRHRRRPHIHQSRLRLLVGGRRRHRRSRLEYSEIWCPEGLGRRDFHGFGFRRTGERAAGDGEFAMGPVLRYCRIIPRFRAEYVCRAVSIRARGMDVDLAGIFYCLANNG